MRTLKEERAIFSWPACTTLCLFSKSRPNLVQRPSPPGKAYSPQSEKGSCGNSPWPRTTHASPTSHSNRPRTSLGLGWASTTGPASTAAASGISRPHQTGFGLNSHPSTVVADGEGGRKLETQQLVVASLTKDILLAKLGSVQ